MPRHVRTVEVYERLGAGGILIEDQQREHKQQRADQARGVADAAVIEHKLRAAMAGRSTSDTMIIGRTDALGVFGMDEALRRASRFIELGVDAVFVAGIKSMADYERVGRALRGALLSAAIFETPGMPWPTPKEMGELGYPWPAGGARRCAAQERVRLLSGVSAREGRVAQTASVRRVGRV